MRYRGWMQLLLLVLVSATTLSARAEADEAKYRALTDAAVDEHSLGHYDEARALFAKAHAIDPNARTLWGMGTAAFEGRHYADAIRLLEASLGDKRKPLTSAQISHAESLIRRSADFVVRVQLDLQPRTASVSVDGQDFHPDSRGLLSVDPGAHQILVVAKGYRDHVRSVQWASGAARLRVRLEPDLSARDGVGPVQAQAGPGEKPAEEVHNGNTLGVLKWVAFGAALASFGVAGAGIGLRQVEAERWNDDGKCPEPKRQSCSDTPSLVHRWEAMTIAGSASAGLFAITAGILFAVERRSLRDAGHTKIACGPAELGLHVSCRGRF